MKSKIKCKLGLHKLGSAVILGYHQGNNEKVRISIQCTSCGESFEYDTNCSKGIVREIS